jgi:hypothetical protein
MTESWEFGQRPMPANARFADFRKVDPREFDLAILHFDENVLTPENTNGLIGGLRRVQVSRAATPAESGDLSRHAQFHGQYNFDYRGLTSASDRAERRRRWTFRRRTGRCSSRPCANGNSAMRGSLTVWIGRISAGHLRKGLSRRSVRS